MAQLRNRINGLVRSSQQVDREIRSMVSCGAVINYDAHGEDVVFDTPRPAYDLITQSVREIAQELTQLGHWEQRWEVVSLDAETVAANQASAKVSKWADIKASRDRRKDGGVLVNGKWFHSDSDSRIQHLGLVLMAASVPAVEWKAMDGTFTIMSQALAGQIFAAVAALDMALFANAESHRTAMEASATPATYDFSTGWPDSFIP